MADVLTTWGRPSRSAGPAADLAHRTVVSIECLLTTLEPTDAELGALVRLVIDAWHATVLDGLDNSTRCARPSCDVAGTWVASVRVPNGADPEVSTRMCGRHAGALVTARLPGVAVARVEERQAA